MLLCSTVMVDAQHYTFVQSLWTLGDHDVSCRLISGAFADTGGGSACVGVGGGYMENLCTFLSILV